jgi:hypothetical protein
MSRKRNPYFFTLTVNQAIIIKRNIIIRNNPKEMIYIYILKKKTLALNDARPAKKKKTEFNSMSFVMSKCEWHMTKGIIPTIL